ncbi:hypothetical protein B0H14DRAFT_1504422 [Mycena olivaceomarginata]|nr:hypothetical protein B0H14DRAFT_1504422 [Mycena olivaceomarginata]
MYHPFRESRHSVVSGRSSMARSRFSSAPMLCTLCLVADHFPRWEWCICCSVVHSFVDGTRTFLPSTPKGACPGRKMPVLWPLSANDSWIWARILEAFHRSQKMPKNSHRQMSCYLPNRHTVLNLPMRELRKTTTVKIGMTHRKCRLRNTPSLTGISWTKYQCSNWVWVLTPSW